MSAIWPTAVAADADLYIAKNSLQTTLATALGTSDVSVVLASSTGFPTAGAVTIDNEVIFYTGISGATLTGCTRGADGTTAATHSVGVPVGASIVAFHHNGLVAEIEAIETYLSANIGTGATPLTASRALATNSSKKIVASSVLDTELAFLSGVTSAIQTQFGLKAPLASPTFTGTVTMPTSSLVTGSADADVVFSVTNTGATSNCGALVHIDADAGFYDPRVAFRIGGGGSSWLVGVDNSDSDSFKISQASSELATNNFLKISTSGAFTLGGAVAMGTNKITGLGNGTAAQDAAAYTQVKILQVLQANYSTEVSSTSGTYADTGLTINITPSSSSSKILVLGSVQYRCRVLSGGSTNATLGLRLKRDATSALYNDATHGLTVASTGDYNVFGYANIVCLDAPATTSAITYKIQMSRLNGTGTVYTNDGSTGPSTITVIEVNGL